jgi:integrase
MSRHLEGPWFRKSKNTWYATLGGKNVSLGIRGKENRKTAQEAWHRLMADGPKPNAKPEPKAEAVTVRELVAAFLADVADRAKPKTLEVYRYFLDTFVAKFGHRSADGVKPHEVEAFARRPSWSSSTRHDFLGALVMAFRWAVRAKLLATNPLADVRKPPKTSRGVKAVVSADQYARLAEAAPPAFQLFLSGLWLTGCRPGELARVEAKDVDFKTGVSLLAEHKTAEKTGRPRVIYLSPEAVARGGRPVPGASRAAPDRPTVPQRPGWGVDRVGCGEGDGRGPHEGRAAARHRLRDAALVRHRRPDQRRPRRHCCGPARAHEHRDAAQALLAPDRPGRCAPECRLDGPPRSGRTGARGGVSGWSF